MGWESRGTYFSFFMLPCSNYIAPTESWHCQLYSPNTVVSRSVALSTETEAFCFDLQASHFFFFFTNIRRWSIIVECGDALRLLLLAVEWLTRPFCLTP